MLIDSIAQNYFPLGAQEKTEKTPENSSNFYFGLNAGYQIVTPQKTRHGHFIFQSSPRQGGALSYSGNYREKKKWDI
ncbi:hypothetical protein [Dyadobacter sp. OTU695]|uniref:hypothetical protein n=1 Tax=Dyadobacter sp. OTU695 TaxID=3043860 RepID=UPI00313CBB04